MRKLVEPFLTIRALCGFAAADPTVPRRLSDFLAEETLGDATLTARFTNTRSLAFCKRMPRHLDDGSSLVNKFEMEGFRGRLSHWKIVEHVDSIRCWVLMAPYQLRASGNHNWGFRWISVCCGKFRRNFLNRKRTLWQFLFFCLTFSLICDTYILVLQSNNFEVKNENTSSRGCRQALDRDDTGTFFGES